MPVRSKDPRPADPEHVAQAHRLARVATGFFQRGWCLGTSGNFSVVVEQDPTRLLVTRSGAHKGELGLDDFVLVDAEGRPASDAHARPSAETLLHAAIVACRGAGAVLHTHSVAGTLLGEHFRDKGGFTISGYEMLKGLEGTTSHEAASFVPVIANSQDMRTMSRDVRSLLGRHCDSRGFLIAGHGLYSWGQNLDEARRHVEIFEFLLELHAQRTAFRPFVG